MDIAKKHLKGGLIHAKIRKELQQEILKDGVLLVKIADFIEQRIEELGGEVAFPVGIGINNHAAHWNPPADCTEVLQQDDLITIDFGVHIDGYITDAAFSYSLSNKFDQLLELSKQATMAGVNAAKMGQPLAEVGRAIEQSVKGATVTIDNVEHNVNIITSLCGHKILPYKIHGFKVVPNHYYPQYREKMEENEVYAIEPFITTAPTNKTTECLETPCNHYMINYFQPELEKRARLSKQERLVLAQIKRYFKTLCFAPKWLYGKQGIVDKIKPEQVDRSLASLAKKAVLNTYPLLIVPKGHYVSQFESNILITKEKPIFLTGRL